MNNKKIAITLGDINGVSIEVVIKALNSLNLSEDQIILIGSKKALDFHQNLLNMNLDKNYHIFNIDDFLDIDIEPSDIKIGKDTKLSGIISYSSIKKACELALNHEIKGIVTAPVSKNALNLAGYNFNGQTEILQYFLGNLNKKAQMLFVANNFRVLLLTRHIPLKDVYKQINEEMIYSNIYNINEILKNIFKIKEPRIAICSLNPHAGENGLLGTEEKDIFLRAIKKLSTQGVNVTDPMPADTLFTKVKDNIYDCFISCYHDQGLIPIKLLAMENTVNLTVGLDILRSSPAHGTAFDIAGKNIANEKSMIESIKLIFKLIS